jgi:hypothetical protein
MCGNALSRSRVPVLAAALAAGLVFCGRGGPDAKASGASSVIRDILKSGPVLRVEAAEFTNRDFKTYLDTMGAGDIKSLPAESLSGLFDKFVDEKILLEASRRKGLALTQDEKNGYLAKLSAETPAPGEASPAAPQTPASTPEEIFDRLLVEKYTFEVVAGIRVEDAEVEAYYEAHKRDFLLPERVQVSQILVPTEEKAVAVLRKVVNASEQEFRLTAQAESTGPEAARGGLMGIYKPGDLPNDMSKVIFALDEGRTSQVVESSYGYHIFRLDRKFPPQLQPLAEAAPAIRIRVLGEKVNEAMAAHLAELKNTLSWRIFPDNLFFAYQRSDS